MPRDDSEPKPGSLSDGGAGFAAIVDGHWTPVYRYLLRAVGDPHDAEDLTQETFLRAWRHRDGFQAGTNLRAWLLRIATNAALDVRRRRRRSPVSPLVHDPAGPPPDPGHRLEVEEQGRALLAALAGLSELTRMVFHLRAAEDLSFREIAECVGTTEQGARWHMHHARTRLLEQLTEKS